MDLVNNLIDNGYLKTKAIVKAFQEIKRVDFLPANMPFRHELANMDKALPIGENQTISQPAVVAFMLELLDPRAGNNILDIGYGSGWTTALLANIVAYRGANGKITAIERIAKLAKSGKKNINRYGYIDKKIVRCVTGDGYLGYPDNAPYDRILASAAANKLPNSWLKQLKNGGVIVAPLDTAIARIEKKLDGGISEKKYEGFVFVPLVKGANITKNNNRPTA